MVPAVYSPIDISNWQDFWNELPSILFILSLGVLTMILTVPGRNVLLKALILGWG